MTMLIRVRRLLTPPVFEDQEQSRLAGLLYLVSLSLPAAAVLMTVNGLLFGRYRSLRALVIGSMGALVALWLTRRGRLKSASLLVLLTYLGVLNYMLCRADGIHDISVVAYPLLLIMAGLMLNKRAFVGYTLLTILSLQGIVYGELHELVVNRFSGFTSPADFVAVTVIMLITAVAARQLSDSIAENIAKAHLSQRALTESNRKLQREIDERMRTEQVLRQSQREFATLYEATTAISSDLSLEVVLQTVAEQMIWALGVNGCTLSLWKREENLVETLVDYNTVKPGTADPAGTTYDLADYPATRRVLETGQSALIRRDDPAADQAELALMERQETVTLLMLPLVARDRVVGLVELVDDLETRTYTPDQIRLAQSLTAQAAIAIENARLYRRAQQEIADRVQAEAVLRQYTRALARLNQLGQNLTATLNLEQIAERLSRVVTDIVGTESVSVWLADPEREGGLVCWASSDHFNRARKRSPVNLRLRPGQGIAGWVVDSGKSVIVPDVFQDPRFYAGIDRQTGFQTRSLLSVPLWTRSTVIGVLEMLNKLNGEFTPDDVNLVEILAASVATAIENARLVEALRQQTVDLAAQNVELDAFAHTAAHDLKGPLAPIVGYAQAMEVYFDTMSAEEMRRHLHLIAESGIKMSNIVDELLLLATMRRIEEVKIEPLDMARVVTEAIGRLAHMVEERQAELITPPAEAWLPALGYGPWIEEVWINYLSNALKYGGHPPRVELGFDFRFSISDLRGEAHRAGDSTGFIVGDSTRLIAGDSAELVAGDPAELVAGDRPLVRFWVRDNGPGLTPEEQDRLFTSFTRLDRACAKGHGLGLSIVRRIVERLGGQVGVESEVGQGSRFWFALPAYRAQDDAPGERDGRNRR